MIAADSRTSGMKIDIIDEPVEPSRLLIINYLKFNINVKITYDDVVVTNAGVLNNYIKQ